MTEPDYGPRSNDPLTCLIETVGHSIDALNQLIQDLPAGQTKDIATESIAKAFYQMTGVANATGKKPQSFS